MPPTRSVACPKCGAQPGFPCVAVTGRYKGMTLQKGMHVDRVELLVGSPSVVGPIGVVTPAVNDPTAEASGRTVRIKKVLFGIQFARKIGMSQEALDLRLAEMIVDAGADKQ